jgi:acyl homoserine lactone synthase
MLRFLTAAALAREPLLADTMFADRARQFRDRLGWAVEVGPEGRERDAYDARDPIYVIWQRPDGRHGGSMRFLPTTGPTLTNDRFAHLNGGRPLRDPRIWEVTRFCLAPGAGGAVSAALMLGGSELGLMLGLTHALAVFDARMVRIYRRLGWGPIILGADGAGPRAVSLGLWAFSEAMHARLAASAGIPAARVRAWFRRDALAQAGATAAVAAE